MRTKSEIATAFAPTTALEGYREFFLVGIGGAGMSGIARMLATRGYQVVGNDASEGEGVDALRTHGIPVHIGHTGSGIEPGMALVLSDAIDLESSPEVARARHLGCPLFRRSQVLGWILRNHRTIAVTGTHGKTTTSGMTAAGLRAAGLDPVVVIGAEVPDFGGAIVEGTGEWAVVEACEAYDSFHDLRPEIIVLTNLEPDHLDFHGSWEGLRESVERFVMTLPSDGTLIYAGEDAGASEIARRFPGQKRSYGLDDGARRTIAIPGRHSLLNAQGALAACDAAGAQGERAWGGISSFGGASRRLQVMREGDLTVIDDYAHHPTEIAASIQALRERYPDRRLVVVYQPHLYSRTAQFLSEFASALDGADHVVLTDIYPAREAPLPGVSSSRIAEQLNVPHDYVPTRHLLPRYVHAIAMKGDVIAGMGAGTIGEFAPAFIAEMDRSGPTRVAVVYGGDSAEREVSLLTGRQVADALERKGYAVVRVDVTDRLLTTGDLSLFTGPNRPDIAFFGVHGTHAEDGAIQGLFELLAIPYTGSSLQASATAMDKALAKQVLTASGLPVARGVRVTSTEEAETMARLLAEKRGTETLLRPRLVVKPNAQGSTIGLTFVDHVDELVPAVEFALRYDSVALVEERIEGMEISVPVLGDRALPAVEIVPPEGRYDFAAKYEPGATIEICPARLSEATAQEAAEFALRAHRALGCSGATRTDMMVREGRCVVLEVNTLPGMTLTSLLPRSAQTAGIGFDDLCAWMVDDALVRSKRQGKP
ncbi:MAG TPA: D-alanine--D-alanine ligase [Fimbriimonadaceae bacterium]|nr:D-alanine--D-alanine ligase [Fimbriimonadaceae bacterium]